MTTTVHSTRSSYREMLLEHLLVGEILRHLWIRGNAHVEFLKPQVDDAGYDIVLVCNSITRHIQLKTSHATARRANVDLHLNLAKKDGGCVIWTFFDATTLELGPFLWFGGRPGKPLPEIKRFKAAKHTRADATGKKGIRPNLRLIPKGKFEQLATIADLVKRLFG